MLQTFIFYSLPNFYNNLPIFTTTETKRVVISQSPQLPHPSSRDRFQWWKTPARREFFLFGIEKSSEFTFLRWKLETLVARSYPSILFLFLVERLSTFRVDVETVVGPFFDMSALKCHASSHPFRTYQNRVTSALISGDTFSVMDNPKISNFWNSLVFFLILQADVEGEGGWLLCLKFPKLSKNRR